MLYFRWLWLILVFLEISILNAQLSPGKLNKVHQDLEGVENCTKCHVVGKKLTPERCLDCHQLLKRNIEQDKGLHANQEFKQCQLCHIEHHGRNSKLVYWKDGKENFNHEKTGFQLKGAHAGLKCEKCHNEKNIVNKEELKKFGKDLNRTFLGLQTTCLSCHIDEHRGQLPSTCQDCHNEQAWKPAPKFDHGQTKFPLTGQHQKVPCQKCHIIKTKPVIEQDSAYLNFKIKKFQNCVHCHQDKHRGRLGRNCEKCHTTLGWKLYNKKEFNHDLTPFPLKGKHQTVACQQCHKNQKKWRVSDYQTCSHCHEDYHRGQFSDQQISSKCENCHTVEGFSPSTFTMSDHAKTNYALQGAHQAVPCILCHKKENDKPIFKFQSTRCATCHKDPHGGQVDSFKKMVSSLTKKDGCEHCHSVKGWNIVSFDHSLTKFSLIGRHQGVACQKCHPTNVQNVLQFSGISAQCSDCHKDIHYGQFKQSTGTVQCERCHSPTDWKAEKFDHNRNARFKLTGAHQKVACQNCHPVETQNDRRFIRYKPLPFSCKSCHGNRHQQPERL